ncbi:hypothetical protein GYMLUDRAFT_605941 [Collybiopsis luxurians FD-317 M1]|uniref:Unplaced genomic scaffold GYMLUscaffold_27, whole genome shotgun sequence n=1 Tax=Collybiopsis luxurians FD-317 M1 TaxID=944289 RepID=A0A0D0CD06_9AGAR|nr:hypothetical protein GYMLUDRAFT_605941 [Collybiopsis luxurians FD-317 M1]
MSSLCLLLSRFHRITLVEGYSRYLQRYYLLFPNPLLPPLSMNSWCCIVENYTGPDLEVPPKAESPSSQGVYECFYPSCDKKYQSKQYRDNHFDKVHLGVRYFCNCCNGSFMNKGSIKKHKDLGRCPGIDFGQ